MQAEEYLRQGNLSEALSELQNSIRQDPANVKYRIFLFQLLSVMGQWERALTQLSVAGEMDASTLAMVQTYREAIQCEAFRKSVFSGQRSPLVFGEPEHWIALLIEAARLTALGEVAQADALRDEAFEAAPTSQGTLTTGSEDASQTHSFQWIADADPRLGPMLEAIVNGRYYWIPFHRIRRIDLDPPADLRDVVWMPAHFVWSNGGETVGLIPTRYPGTESVEDDLLRLARKTEWTEQDQTVAGWGQRMLATDVDEFSLMEIRQVTFEQPREESEAKSDTENIGGEQNTASQEPSDG
jgi:type VI secretion system protein ImpE